MSSSLVLQVLSASPRDLAHAVVQRLMRCLAGTPMYPHPLESDGADLVQRLSTDALLAEIYRSPSTLAAMKAIPII